MSGYTKLFARILDSTVWREPNSTRILWITMLALADRDGIIHCTAPGLADRARISIEECRAGLQRFLEPDRDSLTMEDDGRRIRRVDDGFMLLNYEKYRHLVSKEDRNEKARIRMQRYRDRNASLRGVTPRAQNYDIAEAEAEISSKSKAPL